MKKTKKQIGAILLAGTVLYTNAGITSLASDEPALESNLEGKEFTDNTDITENVEVIDNTDITDNVEVIDNTDITESIEDSNIAVASSSVITDEGLLKGINTILKRSDLTSPVSASDLSSIKGDIDVSSYNVKSIEGLQYATRATGLNIDNCEVTDLSPVSEMSKITYLSAVGNNIVDISCLNNHKNLKTINLSNNKIERVELSKLNSTTDLILNNNNINYIKISTASKLINIHLNNNKLKEISGLSNLPKLTTLWLENNELEEIILSNTSALDNLYAKNNKIQTVDVNSAPLALILDLTNNKISDVNQFSKLHKLHTLILKDNELYDLNGISNLRSLANFNVDNNYITDISEVGTMTTLKDVVIGRQRAPLTDVKTNESEISDTIRKVIDINGQPGGLIESQFDVTVEEDKATWRNLIDGKHDISLNFESRSTSEGDIGHDFKVIMAKNATVDLSGPEISVKPSTSTFTPDKITLEIDANDILDNAEKIILPDGTKVEGNKTYYDVYENGDYEFGAEDGFGNTSTKVVEVTNIDKDNPTASPTINPNTWTNKDVEINLNVTDETSDIESIYQVSEDGKKKKVDQTVTVKKNGTYTFEYNDLAGNKGKCSVKVDIIDNIKPSLGLKIVEAEANNTVIQITAKDLESGLKSVLLPNGKTITDGSYQFSVKEPGDYIFAAKDVAGNVTTKKISVTMTDKDDNTGGEDLDSDDLDDNINGDGNGDGNVSGNGTVSKPINKPSNSINKPSKKPNYVYMDQFLDAYEDYLNEELNKEELLDEETELDNEDEISEENLDIGRNANSDNSLKSENEILLTGGPAESPCRSKVKNLISHLFIFLLGVVCGIILERTVKATKKKEYENSEEEDIGAL